MSETFPALVADPGADGELRLTRRTWTDADLPDGDVDIAVRWSGVNYKDALAVTRGGGVARGYPLVPGIDLAGTVTGSTSAGIAAGIAVGSEVLVHGYGLGVSHHGGFAGRARVPAGWVVPLPAGMDARTAMVIGTAGFTAAASVARIQAHGTTPADGPVVVTGASGGVGGIAVDLLAGAGFEVHAVTGTAGAADLLRSLGASVVLDRAELAGSTRPLAGQRWSAGVDCVGGTTLASVLAATRYGGIVTACGLTGGSDLPTTVLPFALRALTLAGIDSVALPLEERRALWHRLADDLRPRHLGAVARQVRLDDVPAALADIRAGRITGRTIVDLEETAA